MKIQVLLGYVEKVNKILKLYEDKNINYMLDDIYDKISGQSNNTGIKEVFDIGYVISFIENKSSDDIYNYIKKFSRLDLLKLARYANLNITKSENKNIIAETIANHFGFLYLGDQIENRNNFSRGSTSKAEY